MSRTAADVVVPVSQGVITGQAWGDVDAPVLLCVPGFSQDERCFSYLAPPLAETHRVVAVSLRGRGRSTWTDTATWGPASHAADVLDVATALGVEEFSLVGWSFGALVTMELAKLAPARLDRAVLVDAAGTPDEVGTAAARGNQQRLVETFPSVEAYVEACLASGMYVGREDWFRPYLAGDLVEVDGGWRTRTTAVIAKDAIMDGPIAPQGLWPYLTMPTLLLRAAEPMTPLGGFIVPESERDAFLDAVPTGSAVDVPANHATIGVVPETVEAIAKFLAG